MRTSSTSAAGWRVSERASERTRTKRCSPCLLSRRFHRRSPPSSSSSSCMQPIVFYFIPCLLRSCTLALLLLLSSSPSSSSLCYGTYFVAAVSLSSYCLTASHPASCLPSQPQPPPPPPTLSSLQPSFVVVDVVCLSSIFPLTPPSSFHARFTLLGCRSYSS